MRAAAPLLMIVAALVAAPGYAQDAGPAPVERVAAEPAPVEPAPVEPAPVEPAPVEPAPPTERADTRPPFIEDLAVAASNPDAAPMVTAIITDESRVEHASIFFRRPGDARYAQVPLAAGEGGLFLARLPDGTQHSGFDYFVVASDGTNGASLGSEDQPFSVAPAREGTLDRLERERRLAEQPEIHPGWVMVSLGVGILASAGSAAFFYDFGVLQQEIAQIDEDLTTPDLDERLQAAFQDARDDRVTASTGDFIFGGVLGVVALVGLGTGVGLLIASGLEE